MLLERNENRKLRETTTNKPLARPPSHKKNQKENKLHPNLLKKNTSRYKNSTPALPLDPKKAFKIIETNKVKSANLKKILSHEIAKSKENFRGDMLKRHSITPDIRARMVS